MIKKLTQKQVKSFQKKIWGYYKKHGRKLPWRKTTNPYRIIVSEIMLQQTQVRRVLPKYKEFLRCFPTFKMLSEAKGSEILKVWQGLGYNRRALSLKKIAERVRGEFKGRLPQDPEVLKTFSGIGEATASSIITFAFSKPTVFVETNIRSVFIHTFFSTHSGSSSGRKNHEKVYDREILSLVEQTLDKKNPREWYFALMDYGVLLKERFPNPNRKSVHYNKQKPFKTSGRYIRGQIIKLLTQKERLRRYQFESMINREKYRIKKCLGNLIKEGFIKQKHSTYFLD